MTTNPPGAVERQVRTLLRADQIRRVIPVKVRRRRRVDWVHVLLAQRCRVVGGGRGRR